MIQLACHVTQHSMRTRGSVSTIYGNCKSQQRQYSTLPVLLPRFSASHAVQAPSNNQSVGMSRAGPPEETKFTVLQSIALAPSVQVLSIAQLIPWAQLTLTVVPTVDEHSDRSHPSTRLVFSVGFLLCSILAPSCMQACDHVGHKNFKAGKGSELKRPLATTACQWCSSLWVPVSTKVFQKHAHVSLLSGQYLINQGKLESLPIAFFKMCS